MNLQGFRFGILLALAIFIGGCVSQTPKTLKKEGLGSVTAEERLVLSIDQ